MSRAAGVVIVGAGQAGVQVAAALRRRGHKDAITLIGDEPHLPYQRPPLSKESLAADAPAAAVPLRPATFYAQHAIDLRTGRRAVRLDRDRRTIELDDGERLAYAHAVLATGARARPLAVPGADLRGVIALRTLDQARALTGRLTAGARVVVIGGGFIGLEVAAAARRRGAAVTILEATSRCMGRALSAQTAGHLVACHEAAGASVRTGVAVGQILDDGHGHVGAVACAEGASIAADVVVVGIGITPATELAERAGLMIDDGIVVDARLRTADPVIWAVGDCCRFPLSDGRLTRLESVQNATDQASAVAGAIAGDGRAYDAVPWFWSNQHDRRVQIAGLLHGHDRAVIRRGPESDGFSVYLYGGDRLLAVESVNRPRDHLLARKLLAADVSPAPADVADVDRDLGRSLVGAPTAVTARSRRLTRV